MKFFNLSIYQQQQHNDKNKIEKSLEMQVKN